MGHVAVKRALKGLEVGWFVVNGAVRGENDHDGKSGSEGIRWMEDSNVAEEAGNKGRT